MKKIYLSSLACLIMFLTPFIGISQQVNSNYSDGQIWVKTKSSAIVNSSLSINGTVNTDYRNLDVSQVPFLSDLESNIAFDRIEQPYQHITSEQGLNRIFRLTLTDPYQVDAVIKSLSDLESIEYAEKVALIKKTLTPNDPDFNSSTQWALFQIGAQSAWNLGTGDANVVVAIVDDAVEITHSDLSPIIWTNSGEIAGNGIDDDGNGYIDDVNGYDVANMDNDPNPDGPAYDHGTHVAGISGAATNNGNGIASIGYNLSIMAVKSTNSASVVSNGYDGIVYAVNSGADVINMSWGGSGSSSTAQSIIDFAYTNGIVCIAAAGNDDVSTQFYPAAYNNVISVASSTFGDAKSGFSNYGSWIDITAPGSAIWSTVPGNSYAIKQGTSMASPMVAGLAGLLLSLNPGLNPDDVESCIRSTADNIDGANPSYIGDLGDGRINALAAMNCVSATLNWAPVADFSGAPTNIIEGQAVNFTDLSYYNPTTWTWTFTGGTPASFSGAVPPAITYNVAGTYQVELTVTNANGTDTKTEVGYVTVNALTGCDTISNTVPTDSYQINRWTGTDGFVAGHNSYGMVRFAEQYTAFGPTSIMGAEFYFVEGETATPASFVRLMVWDDDGAGMPGTMVYSEDITMQEIEDNVTGPGAGSFYITNVTFDTPATVTTGTFHVGYSIENATAATDSAACSLYNVTTDGGRPNKMNVFFEAGNALGYPDNSWQSIETVTGGAQFVMHIYPRITATPPTAVITSDSPVCEGDYMTFGATTSPNSVNWEWAINGTSTPYPTGGDPSVIMTSAGTHTVYMAAYNSCGFFHVDSIDVVVNATPNVGVTASADTVCPAGSSNLAASGATSYVWTPAAGLSCTACASPIATPASTTTYTVSGTTGSCSADTYITIEVDDSAPTANYLQSSDTICPNESVNYNGAISSGASTYIWTFTGGDISSSGSSNPTVTYTAAGTYSVDLTVENTCTQTDNTVGTIVVLTALECATGLDDLTALEGVSAFSNELEGNIQLSFSNAIQGDVTVELVNTLGQMISTQTINNPNSGQISYLTTQGLESAIYLVRVRTETSQFITKLLIK
jgi:serine protease